MKFVTRWVEALSPYKVSKHIAWVRRDNSVNVLKLDWNESTIPPTPLVKDYVEDILTSADLNWYPPLQNLELKNRISEYAQVSPQCVDYYSSSDCIHEYIAATFIEPGDEVLMFYPTYDNFRSVFEARGAVVRKKSLDDFFAADSALTLFGEPKLIYVCSPNNPTGEIIDARVIEELSVSHPDTLFVVDEAYYEFSGKSVSNVAVTADNVIVTRTFSKAFGIASFRMGYVISNSANIELLAKVKNHKNVPLLSQAAALACLDDVEYMKAYVEEVSEARVHFATFLRAQDFVEAVQVGFGNFVMLQIAHSVLNEFVCGLEDANIFIRSFDHIPGAVRITVGTKDQMSRVESVINGLNLEG